MAGGAGEGAVLLRCEGLRVGHAGRAIAPAVDLELHPGEFIAVVGRNGTGKTTWFHTLLGLLPPVGGRVIARKGLRLSYVPQRAQLDPRVGRFAHGRRSHRPRGARHRVDA